MKKLLIAVLALSFVCCCVVFAIKYPQRTFNVKVMTSGGFFGRFNVPVAGARVQVIRRYGTYDSATGGITSASTCIATMETDKAGLASTRVVVTWSETLAEDSYAYNVSKVGYRTVEIPVSSDDPQEIELRRR